MDLIKLFDVSVLRISAIASSVYISILIAGSLAKDTRDMMRKQTLGFVVLFFMSLLVYLVV